MTLRKHPFPGSKSLYLRLIGLFVAAASAGDGQDKTGKAIKRSEPARSLAGQIAALATKQAALDKTFEEELHQAKHDMKKVVDANDNFNTNRRRLVDELVLLIKEHADEPDVLDGFILLIGPMRYFLNDGQVEIALRHLADPRMGLLCFSASYRGGEPWAERLIKEVAEKHPRKDTRGQGLFALGDYYRWAAFPWGRKLPEDQFTGLLAQAKRCYSEVAKSYAAIRTPDGKVKLGDKAAHELARIANLPNLKVGKPAPEIVGESLDGKPVRLGDHRGKVVVVVFWGSWCGPCMAMVPHERELWKRHHAKPFVLLGINCGDKREAAKKTTEQRQMTWTSLWDGDEIRGPIETDYNVDHWPTIYVIDSQGIIRYFDVRDQELEKAVETLLAEP